MAITLDTANALCTVAEAKAHIKLETSETVYTDDVTTLINAVSAFFNSYTRRLLLSRANTEYYDGDGSPVLYLNNYPVTALTTLHIDPDRSYPAGALIASTGYVLYGSIGKVVLTDLVFDAAPQAVKAVYTAGYAAADVPWDMKLALLNQIKFQFQRWKDNREAVLSAGVEGQSVSLIEVQDLLPAVKTVLDLYRRVGHG